MTPSEPGSSWSTHPVIILGAVSPTSTPVLDPNEYQIEARRFPITARKTVKLCNVTILLGKIYLRILERLFTILMLEVTSKSI